MASIPSTPTWSPTVYQIETTDAVLGGPDGVINVQAKQLADRTDYLKQQVEAAGAVADSAAAKAGSALSQIDAIEIAAGSASQNAAAALQHRHAAEAAQALAEQARNAAQQAQMQAGDNAGYAAQQAEIARNKASQSTADATTTSVAAAICMDIQNEMQQAPNGLLIARDQAVAAAASAEQDSIQTAADRVQTGLDRVQTGSDRTQTGSDRSAAAASAAEALGYLQVYRTTSYGPYADDPTEDPYGNPPSLGDEYFNTTANLLKRWNGSTWQASDINTANLAASSGSSLVGYDGGTVQDVLDGAKSLQDYAALRAYTGRASCIYITGLLITKKPAGIAGVFQYDPTDTTSADNGGTVIVGSDGRRWKRDYAGAVVVTWFGTSGLGTIDDYDPIIAAIKSATYGTGYYISGPAVYFPPGNYYCSKTIQLKRSVRLFGDNSGFPSSSFARLTFPAGVTGIIVHRYNTIDNGVESPATTAGDSSIIEGLRIFGASGTPDAYGGHGIVLRARAEIRKCSVNSFQGDGVYVIAGPSGALTGNANGFRLLDSSIYNCKGNGFHADGSDANAGLISNVDSSNNAGWGFYDSSFLGNTYVGCHASGNYGPYKMDEPSAANVLFGCYSEGGQVPSEVSYPSIVIGGAHGAGVTGTGTYLRSSVSGTKINSLEVDPGSVVKTRLAIGAYKSAMRVENYGGTPFDLIYEHSASLFPGVWTFIHDRTATDASFSVVTPSNTTWGRPVGSFVTHKGITFGGTSGGATNYNQNYGSAAPTSGTYKRGDIVWKTAPAAGGKIGWVCTTGGDAGSTAVFKEFGVIDA